MQVLEQKLELDNKKYKIDLEKTFDCGQSFRWEKQGDIFQGVVGFNVIFAKQIGDKIFFEGIGEDDFSSLIFRYFNLQDDYDILNEKLKQKNDKILNLAMDKSKGIRILRQDILEMIFSFIISANNNIPRIKSSIEMLCKTYGEKIEYKNKEFYTFPKQETLKHLTKQDYTNLKIGFRDKYLEDAIKKIEQKQIILENLEKQTTKELLETLELINGIGPKVASCIAMFAFNRFDCFPVDVWITRAIENLYFNGNSKTKKEIQDFAQLSFGDLKGLAQQYLFYYIRQISK